MSTMATNKKAQYGFVSILTVMTITILLSLLTLAFVKVMNRSQRQTLDTQLSTQANYAAETGINDAIRAILNNPSAIPFDDTNCSPTPTRPGASQAEADANKIIGGGGTAQAEYTCQLISSGVKDVRVDINDQSSRIYPIKTDGTNATELKIEWDAGDSTPVKNNFPDPIAANVDQYPALGSWPNTTPSMLRLALYTPCPNGCSDFNSDTMIANQKNLFIKPSNGGSGTLDLSASADGAAAYGNCQTISATRQYQCQITITNLGVNTSQNNALFLKMTPIYGSTAVRFMANNVSGGGGTQALAMYGAQYRVDVTGKANDVYRRLEVRVPLPTYDNPGIGVESLSICKKFEWTGTAALSNACQ